MWRYIFNPFQGNRHGLKAPLNGVNGFTGGGVIFYAVSISGSNSITVNLTGVAGKTADIFSDGKLIATASITKGRAGKTFSVKDGAAIPDFAVGAHIEVQQNGHVILSGVFADK